MEEHNVRSSDPSRAEEAEVYRYGPLYRWGAYGTASLVVLAVIAAGWAILTAGPSQVNWGAYAGLATGLICATTSVPTLLTELYLTEDRLRKKKPLSTDQNIRLDEVGRVFIGGASVELYVSSDTDPDITFHRKIRGGDGLIRKLVGRLPDSAAVDHPSGELEGQLGDRLTGA